MADDSIAERFEGALTRIERPGSFCVSGSIPPVLPGLEIRGFGPIGFPLTADQAEQIKAHYDQAPYGNGRETVVDTTVRRVWQMTPPRFRLTNPQWQEFLARTIATVQEGLGLQGQKLQSHLYNLLLYEKGSFFLPHRDGEKLDRMVATLVIVLPSACKGGQLVVRHEGQTRTVDFAKVPNSAFLLHYAAFYADCEHEVRPVREGYRLCLVYNLTLARSRKSVGAPSSAAHIDTIDAILRDWSTRAAGHAPRKLAVLLEHQYTQDGLAWDALKGLDGARARVLREAARRSGCRAHLALLTYHETGYGEERGGGGGWDRYRYDDEADEEDEDATGDNGDYEMVEVYESALTAERWVDEDGHRIPIGPLPVEQTEVVPEDSLTDVQPQEEYEGYTGNEGMTLERWYRHAAVFLWPEKDHFANLCAGGSRNAVAALDLMVSQWHKAKGKDKTTLKTRCVEFASAILANWESAPANSEFGQEAKNNDPTAALVALDDPDLIRAFLTGVLAKDKSVAGSPALLKALAKHGWAAFQSALESVLASTTTETLERNVRLLEQLCLNKSRQKDRSTLCKSLAAKAVAALEAVDHAKPGDPWRVREVNRSAVLAGLVQILLATDRAELLARLVAHVLATPKKYPLTPVQVQALTDLRPWIKKHVAKAPAALGRWLAACREQLEALTAEMPQEPTDFRRAARVYCKCADCAELVRFLKDAHAKVQRFPMAKERRRHLHETIDRHQLDVSHVTERRGSPHTLVCTKNTESYRRRLQEYQENQEHLATVTALQASLPH